MRLLPLLLALLASALAAPAASACCHVYDLEERVGPCSFEWHGDGLRLRTDDARLGCEGTPVDVTYDPEPSFSPWDLLP